MNFKNVRKYLSLILLVLAIFSISTGVSVAAGENSSTDQAMVSSMVVDNLYAYDVSYSNYSYSSNCSYSYADESVSDLENSLSNNSIIDNNSTLSISISSCNEISNISNNKNTTIKNVLSLIENIVYNASSNSYSTVKINSNLENNLSKSLHNSLFNNLNLTTHHILTILCEENSNQMNKIHLNILDHELIVFNNSNNGIMSYICNKNGMDRDMVNVLLQFDKIFKQRPMNNNELFNFKNQYNGKYNEDISGDLTDLDNYSNKFNMNRNFKEISNIGSFDKNLLDIFSTVDLSINKYLLYNKHQNIIKNNNSLFYILNNSKNNFKIFALEIPITDDLADDMDDDEEPSDSVYLANRLILYINFPKISNGLKYTYKILDYNNYNHLDSGNSISTLILKTSFFNLSESYSFNTDYFIFENISFEIADIRNDSINFGIITDSLSFNNQGIIDYNFISNYIFFISNHIFNMEVSE